MASTKGARTVVAKIGSSTLVDKTGAIDRAFVRSLCDQIATLVGEDTRVVMVSSGAVAAGREILGFHERPREIDDLQACAAAGQALLTQFYSQALERHDIPCGQVLLSRRDVIERDSYLHARNTLTRMFELGAVPVVNENDTVSVAEFTFGDNDMLGAIVAGMVSADLYVILSDVAGLYTANPQEDPTASLVETVHEVDARVSGMAGGSGTSFGTGGMSSKVRAGRAMLAAGIPTVICLGRRPNVLVDVAHGKRVGTRFVPSGSGTHDVGRKLWIGLSEIVHGSLYLDEGATRAVIDRGASILPVGVTKTEGEYQVGDVVNVLDPDGALIGRGAVRYSSEDMARVRGLKLDVIERFLGPDRAQPAIHRDELLVF